MNVWSARHVLFRASRSLRENLYLTLVSTGVVAAALLLVGVYLTVEHNLSAIVDTWNRDVHISAYFAPGVSEQRRGELRDRIAADPRVAQVRYVSEAEARSWLSQRVEGIEGVLDELGDDALPASLEITLRPEDARPAVIDAFVGTLSIPEFRSIDHGRAWVERFNAFLSLLELLGAVLGLLILVAALFLVANTIHLVVYNRKGELEIQKLVGGTSAFITAPFVIEGAVEGVTGAGLAIVGLWAVHDLLVVRLQAALSLDMAGTIAFVPTSWLFGLLAAGGAMGALAAWFAVHRFLARAP